MTFYRAKSLGYHDNIDTPRAVELDKMDTNQANAVDGANGGTYTLDQTLYIGGTAGVAIGTDLSMFGLVQCHQSGFHYVRGANAVTKWRTFQLADSNQIISTAYDYYLCAAPAATRTLTLDSFAADGSIIWVMRSYTGAFDIRVVTTGVTVGLTLPASTHCCGGFVKISGSWGVMDYSANAVPGPGA